MYWQVYRQSGVRTDDSHIDSVTVLYSSSNPLTGSGTVVDDPQIRHLSDSVTQAEHPKAKHARKLLELITISREHQLASQARILLTQLQSCHGLSMNGPIMPYDCFAHSRDGTMM